MMFRVRQWPMLGSCRTLALVLIAVLAQAALPAQTCIDTAQGPTTTISHPDRADDSGGGAECCASCFCCHFHGVMAFAALRVSLVVIEAWAPVWSPTALERYFSPVERPPRA
jgi:hypothetical protein